MPRNREKKYLMRVIDLYRDMPYLWQKDNKLYSNKVMKAEGYRVLLEVYKQFDKNADITKIRKKLENLRTTYVKELKKVRASKQKAAGKQEVYVPTLWYYDRLSFLESTVDRFRTETDPSENDNSSVDEETESVANSTYKPENILLPVETCMAQIDKEFGAYGQSIGFQMKDLNKRQLTIAQKMISDVLFYAHYDQLSESSYVVQRPPNESGASHSRYNQRQKNIYSMPIKSSPQSHYSSPSPSHQTQSP
ncbi:uncharacterized protein LOC126373364 [Pectinophora gossypiella]|uniref:uncharacterized protein LOC126373364 n=1 Tax=Pectinophora gossypiella TaxID=13191 RepID=UPI00214F239F|nr:uncharacterized protein LOC126373364 [Pectinophora gossypiella]